MSTMEYIQLKEDLLKKLIDTKDVKLLEKIKELFNNNKEEDDFFDGMPEYAKKELLESIEQSKRGEVTSFEDAMKEIF